MRLYYFSFSVIVCLLVGGVSAAFEIEAEVTYETGTEQQFLSIISTTDVELFEPIIQAFRAANDNIAVRYTVTSSSDIPKALSGKGLDFDLVISSAMDLQTKLANDGYARQLSTDVAANLPEWANWRNSVFAFTQEPATIVLSVRAFEGLPIPHTRQELIETLRAYPDRFEGKLGTYDIRESGAGYLFATQDSRTSDTYWRVTETFGTLGAKLYCCSSHMIDDVLTGTIAVAYNVLGSYADARHDAADDILIIEPEDFTTVMLRTAFIMNDATNPEPAEAFLEHLLALAWQSPDDETFRFPNRSQEELDLSSHFRPIRLGPGLLVNLDRFKRERFIREWENSILQ